jgi:hypothetical protein
MWGAPRIATLEREPGAVSMKSVRGMDHSLRDRATLNLDRGMF